MSEPLSAESWRHITREFIETTSQTGHAAEDYDNLCPLDNRTECPRWAGPCSVNMALDCPEVHAQAPAGE